MTGLGAVFALAAVIVLLRGGRGLALLVAASAAFPASAAVTVAGVSLTPFALLGAVAAVTMLVDRERVVAGPGRTPLVVFVAWSLLVTAVGPLVFRGLPVLASRTGIDAAVLAPAALSPTVSNAAQAAYLVLGAASVVVLARRRARPLLAAVPLGLGTALASLDAFCSATGVPFPREFFDTSASVVYSDTGVGARLRGSFSEPSELAGFSLAAVAFFALAAVRSRGRARAASAALGALAVMNLNLSSSGTAVIGVLAFSAIAAVALVVQSLRTGGRTLPFLVLAVLVLGAVAVLAGDRITDRISGIVDGKIGSNSYISRTSADAFSFGLALRTAGVGAGLGSNRPSSFAVMLLSCVGVVGLVAFAVLLARLVAGAGRVPAATSAVWALVALVTAKAVSLPDLSTPILWVLLGSCASAAWRLRSDRPPGATRPRELPVPPAPPAPPELPGSCAKPDRTGPPTRPAPLADRAHGRRRQRASTKSRSTRAPASQE